MCIARKAIWACYILLLLAIPYHLSGQCTPGSVTSAHSNSTYDALLDPDSDGFITESGTAFTSGTTEKEEFEILANSVTGWIDVVDISEVDSDVTPNCGNPDLITDNDGGDFAFYNIVDPTPASPESGDEYIVLRFRLAQSPNGNFGYNFLFDTDLQYGAGIDTNSLCGNRGFEREVQFANAGGNQGVSAYDIDGAVTMTATSPPCDQCIAVSDVQEACAASSGGCATTDPQLITFALPMVYLGVGSDINTSLFYVAMGSANSGNATSVLGGGNANDIGAIDGDTGGCVECVGLTGCALFDCQTSCINTAFNVAMNNSLPVQLIRFSANQTNDRAVLLTWATASEWNNDYFEIEYSTDGKIFYPIGYVRGNGTTSAQRNEYSFLHDHPNSGPGYYRLKQVDFDGQYAYSPVVEVEIENNTRWAIVSPTLVQQRLQFEFYTMEPADLSLRLIDLKGRTVLLKSMDAIQGNNMLWLDLSHLPSGMYQLIAIDRQTNRPMGEGSWKVIKS